MSPRGPGLSCITAEVPVTLSRFLWVVRTSIQVLGLRIKCSYPRIYLPRPPLSRRKQNSYLYLHVCPLFEKGSQTPQCGKFELSFPERRETWVGVSIITALTLRVGVPAVNRANASTCCPLYVVRHTGSRGQGPVRPLWRSPTPAVSFLEHYLESRISGTALPAGREKLIWKGKASPPDNQGCRTERGSSRFASMKQHPGRVQEAAGPSAISLFIRGV